MIRGQVGGDVAINRIKGQTERSYAQNLDPPIVRQRCASQKYKEVQDDKQSLEGSTGTE